MGWKIPAGNSSPGNVCCPWQPPGLRGQWALGRGGPVQAHRGGASSSTEGGLEGLKRLRGLFLPSPHQQGPQGWWEQGEPFLSPWSIQWALHSPINRLPGVRGIEVPDLCPARPAPSASLLGFVGPKPGRLLAPDSSCGCRGDRLSRAIILPPALIKAAF